MAKYQYRIAGTFDWISSSGNAFFAISNKIGSGKKITIRSLEVYPTTTIWTGATATQTNVLSFARGSISDSGTPLTLTPFDSNNTLPTNITVTTGGYISGAVQIIKRVSQFKNLIPGGLSHYSLFRNRTISENLYNGIQQFSGRNTPVEPMAIVRNGESVGLFCSTFANSSTVRISLMIRIKGTPKKTFATTFFTQIRAMDQCLLCIKNDNVGEIVEVINVSFEEVGTLDSPYMQLVPVGAVDSTAIDDASKRISVLKNDTNAPDISSIVNIISDTPLLPYNVPQSYLAESSAGSPKGFNYLGTKDFIGPVYRTLFPEHTGERFTGLSDNLNYNSKSMRNSDIFGRRAGITIREGEGVALVSGAETATITTAVTVSGWSSFEFAVSFDVENTINPVLTLTGLISGTEVRIMESGTATEITGAENVTGGSFSWLYDYDQYQTVDIHIHHLNYQFIRISLDLTQTGVSVPIQQIFDRNYLNP